MVNGGINANYGKIVKGRNQRRGKNIIYTFRDEEQWKTTHEHPNHNIQWNGIFGR